MKANEIVERLRRAGIDEAAWETDLLLSHFCGVDRAARYADPDRNYAADGLEEAVRAREGRFPLQYLLGEWPFWKQTYTVTPDCLIPRADTELLVEQAAKRLPTGALFADLCTGSGCVAVSTLCERPDARALAVDLSAPALALARRNAERNGVADRLTLLSADVLTDGWTNGQPRPAAILSNPPYIRTGDLPALSPEVGKEPRMALDGGADGLLFYRALLRLAGTWLAPGGFCLFEIGFDQADDLRDLAARAGFSCEVFRDLGGRDRAVLLER